MSDQKQDYFAQKNYHIFSNLNKVNNLFDDLNILKPNVQLTQRELECLKWIRFNKSAKEIASLLGISHRTVEIHIRNIKDKINIDLKDMFNYGEILT
ncbi:MAG: helix-turn-helix transcriptional regulator [Legionellales bacterium]|nr:helix-turn-helix transcriptional regulator [Legionellales bacterium]